MHLYIYSLVRLLALAEAQTAYCIMYYPTAYIESEKLPSASEWKGGNPKLLSLVGRQICPDAMDTEAFIKCLQIHALAHAARTDPKYYRSFASTAEAYLRTMSVFGSQGSIGSNTSDGIRQNSTFLLSAESVVEYAGFLGYFTEKTRAG
ncbi:hypothetical protein AAMO2058_001155200 [Amorphochlora amoebiformis]